MKIAFICITLFIAHSVFYAQEIAKKSMPCDSVVIVNINDQLCVPLSQKYRHILPITPRYEWNHNSGYCGEVSLIASGLHYGQYLSQFDVRAIANPSLTQVTGEFLLERNDSTGPDKLRLTSKTKILDNSQDLLLWVKKQVLEGYPVLMGVFNNELELYGSKDPMAGDAQYDHIVLVLGFASDSKENLYDTKKYHGTDVILFSDHGLQSMVPDSIAVPNDSVRYYHAYQLSDFMGDRVSANKKGGNMYTLLNLPLNNNKADNKRNFALAVTGISGGQECIPVKLSTNYNYEAPYIKWQSNVRPKAMRLKLTLSMTTLVPGQSYKLYRYQNENAVPRSDFNKNYNKKSAKKILIKAKSTNYTRTFRIKSNEKVFFRCVKAE